MCEKFRQFVYVSAFVLVAGLMHTNHAVAQTTQAGFLVSRVPKSDHHFIVFKTTEPLLAADSAAITTFFLAKEGFLMCRVRYDVNRIELEAISRITTENIEQIINYLGFTVDTSWDGILTGEK